MAGDMYLENLEEFVFDENKIVTYKWLSQTLQVHVNQAKQMLYTFFNQQITKEANSLNVTYFVSGVNETDNGEKIRKFSIVNGCDLEKHKSKLKEVSGVHIYSVQKSQLKDGNSLYITDYDLTTEQIKQAACGRFSSIKCAAAKRRSDKELAELDERARMKDVGNNQSKSKPTSQSTTSLTNGKPSTSASLEKKDVVKTETSKPATKSNVHQKKGQRSAMDMFTSMKSKKDEKSTEAVKISSSSTNKTKQENKSSKGMLAFMSKKPKEEETKESEKKEVKQETAEERKPEKDVEELEEKREENVVSNKKTTTQKPVSKQTKIQKKSKRNAVSDSDEEEENPKKKRRRRIMMAESSSEEESDDEPIPPSPPQQPPAIPLKDDDEEENEEDGMELDEPTEGEGGGDTRVKMVKVWKTRQVLDDDGFMVTEKYFEYETVKVVDEPKPTVSKAPAPKKADDTGDKSGKGKKAKEDKSSQKSIMSFFKKS
ncbi:uncharacterized protein [Antedon mediterranea]|uniref:uncharacterized protein n=1 Tax=Antedon mediterranea TaxID=105859 RepID=UPI003AF9F6BF